VGKINKNMKNNIFTLLISSLLFVACEVKDTDNVSRITNYPLIEVLGDETVFIPQNSTFTDPGAIAKEGSEVIPTVKTFNGNYRGEKTLNTSKPDEYSLTYTATNKDGFKASASRRVIVYKTGDLINSIEGVYTCTISRNGVTPNAAYRDIKYIYIWKNADGTYEISDAFGGWYQYGRALGITYITPGGTIKADNIATNSFTFPGNPLTNSGFGGTANITGLTVDAASKKLVLTCAWSSPTSFNFIATMTQVQL
jgi:hypothetical protein